ncbi:MAG: hypothetical protein HQK49_02865 [Oligoflexia bacterium]|nr:hypothetical protein [Oligoflexia bacterium]
MIKHARKELNVLTRIRKQAVHDPELDKIVKKSRDKKKIEKSELRVDEFVFNKLPKKLKKKMEYSNDD